MFEFAEPGVRLVQRRLRLLHDKFSGKQTGQSSLLHFLLNRLRPAHEIIAAKRSEWDE